MDLAKELNVLRRYLFWHGIFWIQEGSASLDGLNYLVELVNKTKSKEVVEIGFNAGFSSLAFLLSNPEVRVTAFDSGDHRYARVAKQYIDKRFPGRHQFVWGDSKITIPQFSSENPETRFDLIFIDGGHDLETVRADITNMHALARSDTALIIDDLTPWLPWGKGPTQAWSEAVATGLVVQKELFKEGKPVSSIEPPGERSWALGHYVQ